MNPAIRRFIICSVLVFMAMVAAVSRMFGCGPVPIIIKNELNTEIRVKYELYSDPNSDGKEYVEIVCPPRSRKKFKIMSPDKERLSAFDTNGNLIQPKEVIDIKRTLFRFAKITVIY